MERVNMIAAVAVRTRVIGRDNDLPWVSRLSSDLKHFKRLTLGNILIVGLNTWYSFPPHMRPLPDRTTIIVSSTMTDAPEGVLVFRTLRGAIEYALANFTQQIFISGGARMYEEGLEYSDRLYITEVDEDAPGDVFFPDYSAFSKVIEENFEPGSDSCPPLKFRTLERPK